ncbi:hypothetical protein SESBI_41398 [Sesbania bispinosa]|nr:hypothetical protein SESBI_41398 [Sesbania bispinosa]
MIDPPIQTQFTDNHSLLFQVTHSLFQFRCQESHALDPFADWEKKRNRKLIYFANRAVDTLKHSFFCWWRCFSAVIFIHCHRCYPYTRFATRRRVRCVSKEEKRTASRTASFPSTTLHRHRHLIHRYVSLNHALFVAVTVDFFTTIALHSAEEPFSDSSPLSLFLLDGEEHPRGTVQALPLRHRVAPAPGQGPVHPPLSPEKKTTSTGEKLPEAPHAPADGDSDGAATARRRSRRRGPRE